MPKVRRRRNNDVPMPVKPTYRFVASFVAGFELITLPTGVWGWVSGLPFWSIVPAAVLCGIGGGVFLSVLVHTIRTGYMRRGSSYYQFEEWPLLFALDLF
jgi:hypothetical protein